MGKPNFQKTTTSRVSAVAPQLKYIAFYPAEDARTKAFMSGYENRALVYILTVHHAGREIYLYAGKSQASYSRFITHLNHFAFDNIYLFECDPEHLTKSEAAVIHEFRPLLNQNHNPDAKHNKQFFGIQTAKTQNMDTIQHYLQLKERYTPVGLYGFSLPPAIFAVLSKNATKLGCSCSQVIQQLLEQTYSQEIIDDLQLSNEKTPSTNLITAKAYGALHGRSREQIKQYLNQGNRVLGTAKIGRDWVLLNDAEFPKDLRKKVPK